VEETGMNRISLATSIADMIVVRILRTGRLIDTGKPILHEGFGHGLNYGDRRFRSFDTATSNGRGCGYYDDGFGDAHGQVISMQLFAGPGVFGQSGDGGCDESKR
jgi:hypothetical protein